RACPLYRSALLGSVTYQLHQGAIIVYHAVNHAAIADGGKMFFGAFDLCIFYAAQFHSVETAFGLGDKVDVLHAALVKSDRPVRVVFSNRGRNIETTGQF